MADQSFKNHAKMDPKYHYVLTPILVANLVYRLWNLWRREFTWDAVGGVVLAVTLILMALIIRLYSLKVQDRVIRLEERMRLMTVLPEKMRSRIQELTEDQLIALRFASDDELPELVEKTLAGKLDRKAIKAQIQYWRPDHWRV